MLDDLSPEAVAALLANLPAMPAAEKAQLLADLEALEDKRSIAAAREDFLAFCKRVYPEFKVGPHHRHMNPILKKVVEGDELRLTVSMAPRFGKSETISYLFVAYYLGKWPHHQIMMVTHTADLSATFGRKIRNLIDSDLYRQIFPDTVVSRDKSASGDWTTTKGGMYLAVGIGGSVAGRGAHLLIADDLCVADTATVWCNGQLTNAGEVQVGDVLLGQAGWQKVLRKTHSAHTTGVQVHGAVMSKEHPVWTYNRGWARAETLRCTDLLQTMTIFDKIKSSITGVLYAQRQRLPVGQEVSPRVQHLGHDETAVQQPKSGKLRELRGQGGSCMRALGCVLGIFGGYGPRALQPAYVGSNRQYTGIQPGELSLGGRRDATKQQNQRSAFQHARQTDVLPTDCASGGHAYIPHGAQAKTDGAYAGTSVGFTEAELGAAPRLPKDFGWLKGLAARVVGRCVKIRASTGVAQTAEMGKSGVQARTPYVRRRLQKTVARGTKALEAVMGFLVGVRSAGAVQHIATGTVSFVNFEVAGDNTFFADGVLTHNCSEQAVLAGDPDKAFATAWDYVQVGPLQRLMPGGKIIMIGTRWSKRDPIGRALAWAENNPDSLPWNEVRFPAIMPSGKSLWPEQWPVEQLMAKKAGMAPQFWAAQYMQEPTSEEGALIKREWWRRWAGAKPPKCDIILQSWDTAHGKNDSSDPSAVTTWGVWFNEEENQDQIMLLDCWYGRKEFPELKKFAFEYYREWEPDMVVIEKKAAGAPLIQEMRATGLPIHEFTPSRGNDKRVRVNAVADMFSSGMVWAPETRWAQEVIDQVAEFPNGEFDDIVDTVSQALLRIRQGGLIRLASDEPDEPQLFRRARAAYY